MVQLISNGKVAYAYVGVTTQDVTPALARRYGLGAPRGALIQSVVSGAPAAEAGLRGSSEQEVFNGVPINVGGDLIVGFAGQKVERAADIDNVLVFHSGTALRDGRAVTAGVRVLTVVGRGATFESAIERAYAGVSRIAFDGMQYRRDIGAKARGVQQR